MPSTLKVACPTQVSAALPDWSSLPGDMVRHIGSCFMVTDDLDYYTDFRAVCTDWRSNTDSLTNTDGTDDARFHPSKWALLERSDDLDVITLVNVSTGRFLSKSIPVLLNYFFVGATSGGLLLLGKKEYPHQAHVLNPFTGTITCFTASVPRVGVRAVVVTTSPMRIFIYGKDEGHIMWADQNSRYFHECWVRYPHEPVCMTSFAGNVYFTNRQGSILSLIIDDTIQGRYFQTISVVTIIPTPDPTQYSNYLVESGGELLLVSRPWYGTPKQIRVYKVDTIRMALEPVSITNLALFVSHIRCLSVNANKFQTTILGNCIYFADEIMIDQGAIGGGFRPFTLDRAFMDYCKAIHTSELNQFFDSEGDYSDESDSEDESDEEYNESDQ